MNRMLFLYSLAIILPCGSGCGENAHLTNATEQIVEIDSDDANTSGVDEGAADRKDPNCAKKGLLCFEGGWIPIGKWGAEGDQEEGSWDPGGKSAGYKTHDWKCLICDEAIDGHPVQDAVLDNLKPVPLGGEEVEIGMEEVEVAPETKTLYLSADDSNSQSSPVLVRSMIRDGMIVPSNSIRIWEFLNYYDFSYKPPTDTPLSITQQLRPYDMAKGLYALQIGLQGRTLTHTGRRPINITLVLDTSGSMGGSPIELLKESCRAIASNLKEGDVISMVTWDTSQTVMMDALRVEGPDDPVLLSYIDLLDSNGGTDLHSGLVMGYRLARENFMTGALNRVVLISDGMANVGITDQDIIAEASKGGEDEAIYLVGAGVGNAGSYNDDLMDTVTDWGKGASLFIDSKDEARKMFGERFLATMEVVALDVRVEMTLPPYFVMDKYFGEAYSEEPKEVEPQHLAPNDAMIYQQMIKTSHPYGVWADYKVSLNVTYTESVTGEALELGLSSTLQEMVDAPCDQLRKGDAIVVFAQTLGNMYKLLGKGKEEEAQQECNTNLQAIRESASAIQDKDMEEIVELLAQYCITSKNWTGGGSTGYGYSAKSMWSCLICEGIEQDITSVFSTTDFSID